VHDLNSKYRAADATRICEIAHRRFGSIDVLLNSTVGPAGPTLLHQIPIEDVEQQPGVEDQDTSDKGFFTKLFGR